MNTIAADEINSPNKRIACLTQGIPLSFDQIFHTCDALFTQISLIHSFV